MRLLGNLSVVLALVTIALGLALLTATALEGGGEVGIVIGVTFTAAGAGRLYLARRRNG